LKMPRGLPAALIPARVPESIQGGTGGSALHEPVQPVCDEEGVEPVKDQGKGYDERDGEHDEHGV
jgi:hypothetical protein